eukprot:scaffold37543_cov77-Cyclotella_meneghiniana.AAC.1
MLVGSYNEKKGRGKGGRREKRRRKKEERKEKITFPHPRESQPTIHPLVALYHDVLFVDMKQSFKE